MTSASNTATQDLDSLVHGLKPFYLGGMLSMDYHRALVFLHDHDKRVHGGLPENAFLLATSWFLWNDPHRPSNDRIRRENPDETLDDGFKDEESRSMYRMSERRVLLLRVIGPAPTLNDDQVRRAIMEFHQRWRRRLNHDDPAQNHDDPAQNLLQPATSRPDDEDPAARSEWFFQNPLDGATKALLQHGAVECQLLGTFFDQPGNKQGDRPLLGFAKSTEDLLKLPEMAIYRPSPEALHTIVNYAMPHSLKEARRQVKALAANRQEEIDMPTMRLGVLRYGPADRLQRQAALHEVEVRAHPGEFLARRTAMLGMTRTGKSNAVKLLVSELAKAAYHGRMKLGQLIFDINAEYSHDNWQDGETLDETEGKPTSLATALGRGRAVCYCVSDTVMRHRRWESRPHLPVFFDLRENFYLSCESGLTILQEVIQEQGTAPAEDLQALLNMDLDLPWRGLDPLEPSRWLQTFAHDPEQMAQAARYLNRRSIFQALLYRAGFTVPEGWVFRWFWQDVIPHGVAMSNIVALFREALPHRLTFRKSANASTIEQAFRTTTPNSEAMMDPESFVLFLRALRSVDQRQHDHLTDQRDGQPWLDDFSSSMLNLMAEQNKSNRSIRGYRDLQMALPYHSPNGHRDITADIHRHLRDGKVVILDLSGGKPSVREFFSRRLVQYLFDQRLEEFAEAEEHQQRLAPIMLYVEEAHNLIGLNAQLDDTWPRIAKEGAKLGLGLVYSTQEVSSVHHNILANTENFFITHLNNHRELKCLADYGDFSGFIDAIRSSSEPGFARLNTKSLPYTLSIQVDPFRPVAIQKFFEDAVPHHPEDLAEAMIQLPMEVPPAIPERVDPLAETSALAMNGAAPDSPAVPISRPRIFERNRIRS